MTGQSVNLGICTQETVQTTGLAYDTQSLNAEGANTLHVYDFQARANNRSAFNLEIDCQGSTAQVMNDEASQKSRLK